MLRSIKQLYGEKLGAADGEVGRVKDSYFEESMVMVTVTQAAIRDAAEYHMPRAEYRDARELSESTV